MTGQFTFSPSAEAAHLGSSSASAGSAPPPSVTAIQSFQPDLFTGRAATAIPIAVPPGRKGTAPSLALAYSSSGRNGWVGVGWGLDVGYIERSTKNGVPRYDANDTFSFMFQGVSSDLVQIPGGTYRAKEEGLFLRLSYQGSSGWEVRDKSGSRYLFGQTVASQMENAGQVFRWALDKVIDPNGNTILFTYTKDQGQLYPSQIRYTGHEPTGLAPANQVDFLLEDRPEIDRNYRSGFPVTTAKRLKAVEAKATVAGALSLARRYVLTYTQSPRTGRSLLMSATTIGTDGTTSLPATTFTYTQEAPTYLHCHNCVPSISSGNHGWQIQVQTGNLFPRDDGGNDRRLWPSGYFDPVQICWTEQISQDVKVCRSCWLFATCCEHHQATTNVPRCSTIPQVPWSSPFLDLSGSSAGVSWSTDTSGNLSVSGPPDSHLLAMTWLYSDVAKTVSLSNLSTSGRADLFYVQPGGNAWSVASGNQIPLNPGWTVVALTAYHETGSFSLNLSSNLATQVTAMNHAQFSPMTVTGDFNGDGYADLGHIEPATNHWHVVPNSPSGFGQERTWLNATLPAATVPLVGDADGDGKTDLILWNSTTGLWQVAKSTGISFENPVTWHSGFGAGQTPFMGDFNGDQRLDVGTFSGGTWTIALSNANGTAFGAATTWLTDLGAGAAPLTGDFNGDGLTDVAAALNGTITTGISDGTRLTHQGSPWLTGFGAGQNLTSADLNGDNLTDLLYYERGTGTIVYAPSTVRGFGPSQILMSDHPFSASLRTAQDILQVGDFRGNGMGGFGVFNAVSGAAEIAFALGTPPDLLTTMANGLGGSTVITYKPSSEFDNTGGDGQADLAFAVPVVTKVDVSDGMGNTVTTIYRYQGGRYDAATQEFRGFQQATVIDPAGAAATTTFSQDLHTKGRPLTVELRDSAGRPFIKSTNTWSFLEPFPGVGVHFVKLDQTDSFLYDGDDSFRQTRSRFFYDSYGNLTKTIEDGQVNPPLSGDERIALITYTLNEAAWILNRPRLTQTLDAADTIVAQRRFFYDGATSDTTAPTKGNLTKEEEWLNLPTEQWLATSLTYDSYGNVSTVTDAHPLHRVISNTYDVTGTYLTKITNALGHTRQLAYDPRFGQVTASTDQNGQTTTTIYDSLGRVIKVIGPMDTAALPTVTYEYEISPTPPSKAVTRTRIQSGQSQVLTVYAFMDGLGRTIQTRGPAEDPAKQVVTGAAELDSRGLVVKQWVPYLDISSTSYRAHTLVSGLAPPVTYSYDAVGRLIQTTDPDGSMTKARYQDATVITTDSLGHQTWRTSDGYGRLSAVDEVLSETEMATTTYTYDALNNLTQVADAKGNLIRIAYDSLDRKLSMDDPDMGHWEYRYDAVDNLTQQIDARRVTTTFAYDALNRLRTKTYSIPAGSNIPVPGNVAYTYDGPASFFQVGKLISIQDGSGSSGFSYDKLGRLITETKTITEANMAGGTTYTIQRGYDLLGRLTSLTYPDNEVALYTYNPQGGIETIKLQQGATIQTIVSGVTYNAAGQLTKIAYGNGVTTDYTYHPQTLRLDKLLTIGPTGPLQDFSYSFDSVGNVTSITDRVHTGTQSFQYDALNRLTQATGSYGTRTYVYDSIGNMTSKEGTSMAYGLANGAKPHAVTSALRPGQPALAMAYDTNGNLFTKGATDVKGQLTTQWMSYDAENRLTEVKSAPEETVTVTFQPGWNFFSLAVIPNDARAAAIFPNFSQNFEQIAQYEPASRTFKHYVGNSKFDDFTTLEYGIGYQIYCKNPSGVTLTLKGKLPTRSLSQSLAAGWHLVPAVALESKPTSWLTQGLNAEQILAFDTASQTLKPASEVTAAQAYFIYLATAGIFRPSLPRDPTSRFVYDGDGGRVKKITPAGTTLFLGQSYEKDPAGKTTKYVFAGSQRIASKDSTGSLRFYHTDHLGSSNVLTDSTGAVVELAEYTPYGSFSRKESVRPEPVEGRSSPYFTGQRLDPDTGLYFYNARYYDPDLGRFTQPDTIVQAPSDPQTLNRYSYVRNNPVAFVDPSGHFLWFIPFIIGIAKAALIGAALNATVAAVTGGDIGKAALIGAVGGAILGVGALVAGSVSLSSSFLTIVARAGVMAEFGALAGTAGAAMSGQPLGRGAAVGALGAGAFSLVGSVPFPNNAWGAVAEIGLSAGVGGGISKLAGGESWQGAAFAGTLASARHFYRATLKWTNQTVVDPSLRTSDGSWAEKPEGVVTHGSGSPTSDAGISVRPGELRGWFEKYIGGEDTWLMRTLSRFGPGVDPMSEFHDPYTDALKPVMPSFTSPIYNQSTIPLFYGITVAGALYDPPQVGTALGTYPYDDN